jgi:hypothetical protein
MYRKPTCQGLKACSGGHSVHAAQRSGQMRSLDQRLSHTIILHGGND